MARYTYICENNDCNYKHGFTMNFKPNESPDKVCSVCKKQLVVVDTSTLAGSNGQKSAALVSGVGEINSKLSGDWRDLMQHIKNSNRGSTMKDYK